MAQPPPVPSSSPVKKKTCTMHTSDTGVATMIGFILISLSIILIQSSPHICAATNDDRAQLRTNQELPSAAADTQDPSSQDNSDPSSYESTGSSDYREAGFPPPNELSVIRMNDTSVVLRWDFPEDGQERLQFFKVQYKSTRKNAEWKTDNQEISSTTRAYQISGLRPGNFHFSVIAVYDNDDNVPSAPYKYRIRARSKIKADELPEMTAPKIHWTEAQSDFFRFKWKYDPKEADLEYYGFLVYYRSAHTVSDFTIYNTLDTSVEIAEVDPDTPYEAKVVAYNRVGVSEFSETISIRTAPKLNSSITSSTTPVPVMTDTPSISTTSTLTTVVTTSRPTPSWPSTIGYVTTGQSLTTTTPKPEAPSSHNKFISYQFFSSIFEPILEDQSDAMIIVRYLLMILLPVLFVVLILVFLIRPHKGEKEPPSPPATDESIFHLEINGYFKNSFPGVEEDCDNPVDLH